MKGKNAIFLWIIIILFTVEVFDPIDWEWWVISALNGIMNLSWVFNRRKRITKKDIIEDFEAWNKIQNNLKNNGKQDS